MPCYQYRKSHCGDKTILRPSYLHNGISYTSKTKSGPWSHVSVMKRRTSGEERSTPARPGGRVCVLWKYWTNSQQNGCKFVACMGSCKLDISRPIVEVVGMYKVDQEFDVQEDNYEINGRTTGKYLKTGKIHDLHHPNPQPQIARRYNKHRVSV